VASEAPAAAPAPASQPAAQVRLLASSTDWLTLEADVPAPTILLITDAYDPHWRVTALEGSSQRDYTLMPGDWAFQAVPLAAGHHHLRLEYRPAAFSAGRWISLAAGLLYLGAWLAWWRLGRRPQAAANNANSPAAAAAGHPREN
jgi:hypothetical protein